MTGYQIYQLGDVRLQSGHVLRNARLAYATYGRLSPAGDNAVVLPTFYTGNHVRNEPLFGPAHAIDPARHFVVSINLFGNGISSSPSNSASPQDGPRFPNVTLFDNVACQHRLLTEALGVRKIKLVLEPAAREWLAEKGWDPAYGARPLKRVIQKSVQDPLAEMILAGTIKDGENVIVSGDKLGLTFNGKVAQAA